MACANDPSEPVFGEGLGATEEGANVEATIYGLLDSTSGVRPYASLDDLSTRESGSAVEDVDAATADLPALDHTAFIDSEGRIDIDGTTDLRGDLEVSFT